MTKARWKEIMEYAENGDPLKDIDCDEHELLTYCDILRSALKRIHAEHPAIPIPKDAGI
jgi:hypothetical protein